MQNLRENIPDLSDECDTLDCLADDIEMAADEPLSNLPRTLDGIARDVREQVQRIRDAL